MTELTRGITRGMDWGSYLNWDERIQFDWRQLHDQAGVRFAIFRGDQEQIDPEWGNYSTIRNMAAAREVVPVVGNYYWHYPYRSLIATYLSRYKKAIDRENPDFIAPDLEQTKVIKNGVEVQVDPQEFSDTAQQLCEALRDAYPEKQVIPYTRRDIVTYYSPQLAQWIGAFDGGWEAGGPDYGLKVYPLTWEQIAGDYVRAAPLGNLVKLDNTGSTTIPTWTHNAMRQYSGRILPPYATGTLYAHQYDWNVFYGSEAELMAWVRKTPVVVEPPDPELTLESLDARLKKIEALPWYQQFFSMVKN